MSTATRTSVGSPEPANLPGASKAAVLLIALGLNRAAEVFRHLAPEEIESLTLEMAKMRAVSSQVSEAIVSEAVATVVAERYVSEGGVEYARDLLERSFGADRAAEIMGRLSAVIERRPFEFLRRTPAEQLFAFLRNEAEQTIALVIANLHTELAAKVLAEFGPEEQAEVAIRIARMGETAPEVLQAVEAVMRDKMSSIISQEFTAAGGVKSLADILNNADRSTERNVLDTLTEADTELADEVRRLLFTFEDIQLLDDRSIQLVLKEIDQKDLALALRGVSGEVKDKIYRNLSERGSEMLREEITYQPAQRRRVVEESQGRIVDVVRRLEEAGAIVISRGGGKDELVD